MKQYIINAPQLQSLSKRLSSFAVTVICWVMWGYLLYPIITVINWLRGDYDVINEMRWFGGYKSLLELLQIYVGTLIVLGIMWIAWILLRKLRRQQVLPAAEKIVTDDEIATFYHVETEQIRHFRKQQNVTVFFDEHGQIIRLK
ncbi:MAG: poly-beta-1,6-N-acetyl-D-glucosamine biosynthesis protein PgaD [Methylococcales bacterium]|nr:poly-beta-1,6-N-acetyl-D-glucosamine biosynthesis protein PgaD [Methylococcales bacterium]MDD5754361.1 poly-beta-1,6-N-acetyl-D-glucosamine biosynthesis protein PgaD [Methylococcales bacterium]